MRFLIGGLRLTLVTLLTYKFIAAFLIFLVSLTTVIYPLKKLKNQHRVDHAESFELGEAFASGIFLGAAFFHLLPEAVRTFHELYNTITYPVPELMCVIGFLLLLFLERLSLTDRFHSKNTIPYVLAIILVIHSLTEGAALGIGDTSSETIMLFIAIIAHKSSDSFALCMVLMRYRFTLKYIVIIISLFALMTPIGIGIGTIIESLAMTTHNQLIQALFNAFAAGTFIYISTLHHLRFHQRIEETQSLVEFSFLTLGLSMMAVIAMWS